jgi:hypothetical protein
MKKISIITILVLTVACLTSCRTTNNYYTTTKPTPAPTKPTTVSTSGKCAVLDFQAGSNVTEEELEAVTYNFRTNFHPAKYSVVESSKVTSAIESLNYKKTKMTKEQICDLGRKLETNLVVIGTVSKFMDEYSVDIQVINVSKATTIASVGNTFTKGEYRTEVKDLALKLANKLN